MCHFHISTGRSTISSKRPKASLRSPGCGCGCGSPVSWSAGSFWSGSRGGGKEGGVRFSGQLVGGFVLERLAASEHEGRLAFLERVVSAEQVLVPEIAALTRSVADRWGGSMADVLRLAVPPRHAGAEANAVSDETASPSPSPPVAALDRYVGGDELVG